MKLSGDVPQAHKELAQALEEAEVSIDLDSKLPAERKAQIYTCLAFDWFDIAVEEEGSRLLLKANKVFPDYFKTKVKEHMAQDSTFDYLVKGITVHLLRLVPGLKS